MINFSDISKQIQQWLIDDPNFDGFIIDRSAVVNENASVATHGWIGIYKRSTEYTPGEMGVGPDNYDADLQFSILLQRSHLYSGADCEDVLEQDLKNLLERVVLLPRTYLDHFSGIIVDYTYVDSESKTLFFQGALVTFTAEISS